MVQARRNVELTAAIIVATLLSGLLVETGSELLIEQYFIDDDAGAKHDVVPGAHAHIVNLAPQATVNWASH